MWLHALHIICRDSTIIIVFVYVYCTQRCIRLKQINLAFFNYDFILPLAITKIQSGSVNIQMDLRSQIFEAESS